MSESLKENIATLVGKKAADLKPENGIDVVRSWAGYLAEAGYRVKQHSARAHIADRHVVLYSTPDGTVQSVLSDSDEAAKVTPIGRLTITKTAKTAGEPKAS